MTAPNPLSQDKFNTLRIYLVEAYLATEARFREARDSGDMKLAAALWAARNAIVDHGIALHDAENAYLVSTLPPKETFRRLDTAIRTATAGLAELQALATALNGAARIVNLLRRFSKLFA